MDDGGPVGTHAERSDGSGGSDGSADEDRDGAAGGSPARDALGATPALSRLAEALLLAALAPLLPGVAHLRAGRIRAGALLLIVHAVLLAVAAVVAGSARASLLQLTVRPGWLLALITASILLAGLWAVLGAHSYAVLLPAGLPPAWRLAGGSAATVLCLLMTVPPLTLARYAYLQRDLVGSVFAGGASADRPAPAGPAGGAGAPGSSPASQRAPVPPGRLDLLLIGGDADVGRPGIRTDSMTLASVDTKTGDTVLLSLPRNLQHVPVWSGHGPVPFPEEELLNAVYQQGTLHPSVLRGGRYRDPGAELLKRTIGHILGRPVPYYAMVDMRSFRQIVDAMGGVRVCVGEAVPAPREQVPAGVLRPGCRRLGGREALWYGRSRTGSSDYSRMGRQKCLMWAIARQASPLTVLRSFQDLSQTFKSSVSTDLPQSLLPSLIELSGRVKDAEVTSVQFVPPLVQPGRPDYPQIRRLADRAVRESDQGPRGAAGLHSLGRSCT
ncbi:MULTISPECIES: LCP family protein [Thermomonosporaceae]|uniref:LCP family protein n=1 Tax=Thermomonosporaceae TaxID=2012 RepID=UPI00255AD142|nr:MULTISPECIES: LCP family protein [Thermomonosporaceae]MDL4777836.1 LCP family protein [Actinomadura xylanilytica]